MIKSKLNTTLEKQITATIRAEYEAESAKHEPSGKLSAGQLGKPLLEQVLKVIGVPQRPVEDYALGLFRRGNSVEDNILGLLKPDETQVEVEYRNCVGIVDAIKDGEVYEIKSVKNSQWQYLDPNNDKKRRTPDGMQSVYGGVKYAHALQGALYALALKKPSFTVIYASADDLRTLPHTIETKEMQREVDKIISEVEQALLNHNLPKWKAREDWQEKYPQYSSYPDWISLDPELAMTKLKNSYPDSYKKLINYKGEKK
ncbi:MAG TPA: hypothetical protein PKC05_03330 [Candidatus Saccharibacteria bacterium]|nr:hypothetical protein [Candidatus Saccharibacteria bacterium]